MLELGTCLCELEAKLSDCVCVGDNPNNDLSLAKDIGMKAIWVRNDNFEESVFCDEIIESVALIESTLKKLRA